MESFIVILNESMDVQILEANQILALRGQIKRGYLKQMERKC